MSKAVMLSIQPRWCELIAAGEKTMEVRKTRPKLETPFKCYIYCTMDHPYISVSCGELDKLNYRTNTVGRCNGKVIGEFVCDKIERVGIPYPAYQKKLDERYKKESCCTYYMLHRYCYHDDAFFWHISDLQIYDEPVDITNFRNCNGCEYMGDCDAYCWKPMQRPPQSWCYVEEYMR